VFAIDIFFWREVLLLYKNTIRGARAAHSTQTESGTAIVEKVATDRIIATRPPIRFVYIKPTGPSEAASINAVMGDLLCFMVNSCGKASN